MSDDIKEILDRLERIDHKEYSCGFEFAYSGSFDEDCRCFEERKKLADYITNLQEENMKLITQLEDRAYEQIKFQWKDYKSRCEKAIEYLNNLTNYRFEFTFDNVDRHEIVGCAHNFVKDLLNILNGGDKE